jgi:hypothetical protein
MPEDREMPEYCPVRNCETYLQKLHPQCNRLWQFPKNSFNISDECWFQKRPIGKDTLASFMSTLSKTTGLSQIYTNHSIRAIPKGEPNHDGDHKTFEETASI